MPSLRSWRSSAARLLLFHVPQARGRLVEQQQHRIGAERARNLDDALLAERQAAGQLMHPVAKPDALDLPRGLRQQALLVGAVEPQQAGDRARVAAQVRAERDVLQHRHVRDQLHVLERPRDAEADDALRRRAIDPAAMRSRSCRRWRAARR